MSTEQKRPLILVTNDDGYKAKGIAELVKVAREFGDVVVIAAVESQSARSHAITIKDPLRYKLLDKEDGFTRYVVRGTPADGVKLALCHILDRKPDLLLSGINHGTNSSTSVVYSGTMAAAIEGAIHQIPSIGFSLLDYHPKADFEPGAPYIKQIIANVLKEGLPTGICLNVNVPKVSKEDLRGVKVCRQASGLWMEEFEERADPMGGKYYWLSGRFHDREEDTTEGTDEWALRNNYISLVPVNADYTAYSVLDSISHWSIDEDEKPR